MRIIKTMKKKGEHGFSDTTACELYCDKKFLLRIRKEKESEIYDVTLKCRHPERYVSALYESSRPGDAETEIRESLQYQIRGGYND